MWNRLTFKARSVTLKKEGFVIADDKSAIRGVAWEKERFVIADDTNAIRGVAWEKDVVF